MKRKRECIVCFLLRHDIEVPKIIDGPFGHQKKANLLMERHPEFNIYPMSVYNHIKNQHERKRMIETVHGEMTWEKYFQTLKKRGMRNLEDSKDKVSVKMMMDIYKLEIERDRLEFQKQQMKSKLGLMSDFMMMAMYGGKAPQLDEGTITVKKADVIDSHSESAPD